MASSPPLQVEDQTDEDFFDKLADGDFEPSLVNPESKENHGSLDSKALLAMNKNSDYEQTFDNLNNEVTDGEGDKEVKKERKSDQIGAVLTSASAEEGNWSASSEFVAFYSGKEWNDAGERSEVVSDSTMNKDTGSGVKEVEWSSFYADSVQNLHSEFGSDFFNHLGPNAGDLPGKVVDNMIHANNVVTGDEDCKADSSAGSANYFQHQEASAYSGSKDMSNNGQNLSSQYWESLYPGWKYDQNTGQWYQLDGYGSNVNVQGGYDTDGSSGGWGAASDGKSEVSYLLQASQSVIRAVAPGSSSETASTWNQGLEANSEWNQVLHASNDHNQVPQLNNGYPEHMVFDSQYPGWYYDTIVQEWRSLESCTSPLESAAQAYNQQSQNSFSGTLLHNNSNNNINNLYDEYTKANKYGSQGIGSQGQGNSWAGSYDNNNGNDMNKGQPEAVVKNEPTSSFSGSQQISNSYSLDTSLHNTDYQNSYNSFEAVPSYGKTTQSYFEANGFPASRKCVPGGNFSQPFTMSKVEKNKEINFGNDYHGSQQPASINRQAFQGPQQFPFVSSTERTSAGRPPHALVTFGFGGKLLVLKEDSSFSNSAYNSQDELGGSISVLNMMDAVSGSRHSSLSGLNGCDYFHALIRRSFPAPLVGGNVGTKELHRWIDERIAGCESPNMDYRAGKVLKLLLSLLKIACQHYGKLRSPFGTDTMLRENDIPEAAVAKLFASVKQDVLQFSEGRTLSHCMHSWPSEAHIQATASEVQSLLVSGRKKEALKFAQEGQLWGPALVLASQIGEQFYVDTVKQMALRQLVTGSPLRTLCLLIAGKPADVFSTETTDGNDTGATQFSQKHAQYGSNSMLDEWEENLAVITANRTKGDELVIIHLGDCLWKERSEITAAHICYLLAEANFESYSDTARICLVGADHWKYPRTYAGPEAIQMTELYEYSKALGNSQFMLLPFQPYKVIYAHMLAEVGKLSDSLKYCQAVSKSLKTTRAPEVETLKQLVLSLEERIRTHQQGGYTTNLAPTKLVGKLLNFFDSTAHKVVRGMPPPAPSTSHASAQCSDHFTQPKGNRVSASQSTMAMSSLMPSGSDWSPDSNMKPKHNRSISEPDFGRSPRHVDSSKGATSPEEQDRASGSAGASRFSRFGFGSQLLQKTVGLVLRPRPGKQAKLGERNKFYYDETLKRWVEEGAEPPAKEAALPPPPASALKSEVAPINTVQSPSPAEHSSGIPPIAPNSSHFSARGRMSVRSRYVDTFNKGSGMPASPFHSASVPSARASTPANAKFFIPTPTAPVEQTTEATTESMQESPLADDTPTSTSNDSVLIHTSPPPTIQRFPSMGNIERESIANGNSSTTPHSRRTASWGGSCIDRYDLKRAEPKPLAEALGILQLGFVPSELSSLQAPMNRGNFGDDLHEVEL